MALCSMRDKRREEGMRSRKRYGQVISLTNRSILPGAPFEWLHPGRPLRFVHEAITSETSARSPPNF